MLHVVNFPVILFSIAYQRLIYSIEYEVNPPGTKVLHARRGEVVAPEVYMLSIGTTRSVCTDDNSRDQARLEGMANLEPSNCAW